MTTFTAAANVDRATLQVGREVSWRELQGRVIYVLFADDGLAATLYFLYAQWRHIWFFTGRPEDMPLRLKKKWNGTLVDVTGRLIHVHRYLGEDGEGQSSTPSTFRQ